MWLSKGASVIVSSLAVVWLLQGREDLVFLMQACFLELLGYLVDARMVGCLLDASKLICLLDLSKLCWLLDARMTGCLLDASIVGCLLDVKFAA